MKCDTGTVETAVVVSGRADVAAAAVTGARSVRSPVQHSITAFALARVVQDRLAAA